jgi:hypothetical protein
MIGQQVHVVTSDNICVWGYVLAQTGPDQYRILTWADLQSGNVYGRDCRPTLVRLRSPDGTWHKADDHRGFDRLQGPKGPRVVGLMPVDLPPP